MVPSANKQVIQKELCEHMIGAVKILEQISSMNNKHARMRSLFFSIRRTIPCIVAFHLVVIFRDEHALARSFSEDLGDPLWTNKEQLAQRQHSYDAFCDEIVLFNRVQTSIVGSKH